MIYDLIIIGAGPAGLSAAIYAVRAGLNALVLDKSAISGGQVLNTWEVDNYPALPGISGAELAEKMRAHADRLGGVFENACVNRVSLTGEIKRLETDRGSYECRSVILAMGAVHAKLGIPGEDVLTGAGVSYCATCDGAFFRNKTVAVVGGGDVAAEDALLLSQICKKVYLIHRRDSLRAAGSLQERLKKADNIEILWNTVTKEIRGETRVSGLLLEETSGEQKELEVQGVFIAVGIRPQTEILKEEAKNTAGLFDDNGYLAAGEDGKTMLPGVFAAGDIRKKELRQILTAAADGANCVASVCRYLENE